MPTPLAGWMSNPTTVAHAAVSGGGAVGLGAPSIPGNTLLSFSMFSCAVVLNFKGNIFSLICELEHVSLPFKLR